jgi:hypothetical protein
MGRKSAKIQKLFTISGFLAVCSPSEYPEDPAGIDRVLTGLPERGISNALDMPGEKGLSGQRWERCWGPHGPGIRKQSLEEPCLKKPFADLCGTQAFRD